MTFRGVYKNGVIVVDEASSLREGDVVEVSPLRNAKRSKTRRKAGAEAKKRVRKGADPLPGFGMWKDRPEWRGMTGAEIAAELRRGTFRRKARP